MKIIDNSYKNNPFSRIKIINGDRELTWDLTFYNNPNNITLERVFEFINGYFSTLPQTRQSAIFDIYSEIKQSIDEYIDANMLHARLTTLVRQLYQLIPLDEIRYWTNKNGDIRIPPTIKQEYTDLEISNRSQETKNYENQTYLRDDYLDLVNLAIALKPMIPIWSEYALKLTSMADVGQNKEYDAMAILSRSYIIGSEPMQQLRAFVESSIPNPKRMSAILAGLGSSEIPDWLLSIAIVRKLVVIELSSADANSNIVGVIYRHVNNSFKSTDRKFSGNVRDKVKPSGAEDEDNKSFIETYKIKQEISDGDLAVLSIYTENIMNMARRIDPSVPEEYVTECHAFLMRADSTFHIPTENQLNLVRWVMSPALTPPSINNVNRMGLLRCIAVTQAILWHWGFPELAALIVGTETRDNFGLPSGGIESRSRIPNEYVNKFLIYYPHFSDKGAKTRDRQTNVACQAIDTMAANFIGCDWHIKAPRPIIDLIDIDDSMVMLVPADIKIMLSKLILKIAQSQDEDN